MALERRVVLVERDEGLLAVRRERMEVERESHGVTFGVVGSNAGMMFAGRDAPSSLRGPVGAGMSKPGGQRRTRGRFSSPSASSGSR